MNVNPHNLQYPNVPAIPVVAYMEIQKILAGLPDDASRDEIEEAQMQIDVAAGTGLFEVERQQPGKQGALLNALADWLMDNAPDALADFIGEHYPQYDVPETTKE